MMPKYKSLAQVQSELLAGSTTCRAVVEYYLTQAEQHRNLNAYVELWPEEALAKADELDKQLEAYRLNPAQKPGKLFGAYYRKAQQVRRIIQEQTLGVMQNCDLILMPVTPSVAWRFGEKSEDPVAMYLSDIFTVQANLAGVPALAVPAGRHPENGLPVGVQFMASLWEDGKLLAAAASLPR